jgi:hypothetical protein
MRALQANFQKTAQDATSIDAAVTALDSDKISKTIVDAKGDLIVATAADTVARVSAGSDGTVLGYDDAASSGVRAVYPASYNTLNHLRAMGSTVKASSFDPFLLGVNAFGLSDARVQYQAVYLPYDVTLTGVFWVQQTQGVYTADANNKVGLYTFDGTTMTRVAESTSDGNVWKATSGSFSQKAFSSTYAASAGLYYVALLFNASAITTTPALYGMTATNSMLYHDLGTGKGFSLGKTGQTDLDATETTFSDLGGSYYCGVY